jgi:hypothetical protein
MIVPDGHTDPEKLRQLLTAAEETHLDFKACLDFQQTKDRVEFVKDAVTMANRPPGGYIVIGIDDNGNPCIPAGTVVNPRQFDGANLNQHVRRFIEGETQIVSPTLSARHTVSPTCVSPTRENKLRPARLGRRLNDVTRDLVPFWDHASA